MSPVVINQRLEAVGRMVTWWNAQRKLCMAGAGVLLFIWAAGLLDLFVRYGRAGRLSLWLVLLALAGGGGFWVLRALGRRLNAMAVAAMIERTFPELDNHLINYLQFCAEAVGDPFKRAYVREGVPRWESLNLAEMKNRGAHRRDYAALAAALVLLFMPGLFIGRAWSTAVWRVVNPFSNAMPPTLTRILSVDPGDATILQGSPIVLACKVQGRWGHRVWVDVQADDKEQTVYALGKVAGGGEEAFSHRIPRVNTGLKYRFRAGDAAFPKWYTVKTRPPLAFSRLGVSVRPPDYTSLPARTYDALTEEMPVPAGAAVDIKAGFNLPVGGVTLLRGGEEVAFSRDGGPEAWHGGLVATNEVPVQIVASGTIEGDRAELSVRFAFQPDRLPEIRILAPEGRPVLAPGASPVIAFTVTDDYGLGEVWIEREERSVASEAAESGDSVAQRWEPVGEKAFAQSWMDAGDRSGEERVLAYRVAARDACPLGGERVTRSAPIVFHAPSAQQANRAREALEKQAFAALSHVIELQRENIAKTAMYRKILSASTAEQWNETAGRQEEIRRMTRELLANPLAPLGNLTATVKKLYLNEMAGVIPVLKSVPETPEGQRDSHVANALGMEEKILRQLMLADATAAKAQVQRRVSALTGMLARMVRDQTSVLKETESYAAQSAKIGKTLVDRQDALAVDVTDFTDTCRMEAAAVVANDAAYSALLTGVAGACEEKKIRADMVLAAEKLDQNRAGEAAPHEQDALRKLKELQAMLDEVRAQEEMEREEELLAALAQARDRFEKIAEIHRKAIESMEMVAEQKDKSSKETDLLEEEYKELLKNTKEALLQVPTDLNIFMELNVANDIVEDVFSVFEEVIQAEGSENMDAEGVEERALAKREEYLEGMEEAKDRLDELEQWLANKPDSTKITAEAFDREEMPEAGIALGALAAEAEDLIGDLLEKKDDMAEEADDGAINTAVPDMMPNAEVKEGDVTSFAAQGKSGNETPDHKEQDGRSNVGRQGMSVGETAAGSGTVNKGDENIEARRTQEPTQSGQVDIKGEDVDTKATGGGKLATGKAEDLGMEGGAKRMDSTEEGSMEGLESLLADRAEAMYAKASMQNIRADALKDAAHHLRQAEDAIARGDIAQLRELRKRALAAMKRAKAQIDAAATGRFVIPPNPSLLDDVVEGGPESAPAKYRELVAEYYKLLNESI